MTVRPRSTAIHTYSLSTVQRPRVSMSMTLTAAATEIPDSGEIAWEGVIGMEGTLTGDGRLIEADALRWSNLPLTLRYTPEDVGMHGGAQSVGVISEITRQGGELHARGVIYLDDEIGREAASKVANQSQDGISMDLDDVSFEIRIAKEIVEEQDAFMEALMEGDSDDLPDPEREEDSDGRVTVLKISPDDEVMVTTDARVRGATLVSIPAFIEARIALDLDAEAGDEDDETNGDEAEETEEAEEAEDDSALVAGAAPISPPLAWFANPGLSEPTPLTITEDGRVYGHIAAWDTCHTGFGDQCVSPPSSPSNYAYFHTGSVLTAEGTEVAVGSLTMDTLHAGRSLSANETLSHYEHTGRAVVDVVAGEDAFGIYVAGALRPSVTEEQVRSLRASPISGDWRRIGGNLELVAALAVNVPGFPIPRPQGMVASGVVTSLVASGMVPPSKVIRPGSPGALSTDDLRYLKRLADRERAEHALLSDKAEALSRRVQAVKLAQRVRSIS